MAVPAGAERFDVTFSPSQVSADAYYKAKTILVGEEKTEKTIYTLVLPLNERYAYYDEITWKDNNVDGRYAKVQVGEEDGVPQYEYFDTDRYALYTHIDGDYEVVPEESLEEGYAFGLVGYFIRRSGAFVPVDGFADRYQGYVVDAEGQYYRYINAFTELKDFALQIGIQVNAVKVGIGLGGLDIELGGNSEPLIPDYILEEKDKDDPEKTIPTTYFYESTVSVNASVEIDLGITEGQIDFGTIFEKVLGNLQGVLLEMPATAKGYSSAHFRLDLSIVLDFAELTNSEIAVELINIAETGAENIWLGLYYLGGTFYLDAPFFNIPKLSITSTIITDLIDDLLGDILNEEIYTENELPGASSEAMAASPIDTDNADALLLISRRKLTVALGNKLIRTLIEMIATGLDLDDYITDKLLASAQVELDFNDSLNLDVNINLMMEGSRYIPVEGAPTVEVVDTDGTVLVEGDYYFVLYDNTNPEHQGQQLYVEKDGSYKAITPDTATPAVAYVRVKATGTEPENTKFFRREADNAGNMNEYDTDLNLLVAIRNVDIQFTSQHEYHLTADDLKEYTEITELDRITLTEALDITTRFVHGSDIDLSALLSWLFPEMDPEDMEAIISATSDMGGDVARKIELILTVEIKFAALLNHLRQYVPDLDLDVNADMSILDIINIIVGAVGNIGGLNIGDLLSYINASIVIQTTADQVVVDENEKYTVSDTHNIIGIYMESGEFEALTTAEMTPGNMAYVAPEYRYSHYFEDVRGDYYYNASTGKFVYDPDGDESVGMTRYAYDATYFYQNDNGDHKRVKGGLYIDLSYLNIPSVYINSYSLRSVASSLLPDIFGSSESASDSAVAAGSADAAALPLLGDDIAQYITAFVWGIRMTSTFIQVAVNSNFINEILALVMPDADNRLQFNEADFTKQPYVQINTDRSVYYYESVNTALECDSDVRFYVDETAEKGNYALVDGVYKAVADMSDAELGSYTGDFYAIKSYDSYLKVLTSDSHYFQELSRATAIEKDRAEKSGDNFKYYQKTATTNYEGAYYYVSDGQYQLAEGDESADNEYFLFTAIDESKMLVAYADDYARKPIVSVQLYLWEYEIGINVGFPEFGGDSFNYVPADGDTPDGAKYYLAPDYVYTFVGGENTVDEWIVKDTVAGTTADGIDIVANYNDDVRYIYYHGDYYAIDSDSLYVIKDGAYVPARDVYDTVDWANGQMVDFTSEVRDFYINIYIESLDIERFERVLPATLYKQVWYRDSYVRADGTEPEGTVYYQRTTVENIVSRAERIMQISTVESNEGDYVWNWLTNEFVLGSSLTAEDGKVKELFDADKLIGWGANEITYYAYDSWTRSYMPVGEYLATYYTAEQWEQKTDEMFDLIQHLALYDNSEEINYVDSDDMFFISLTIRGGFSISGYHDYMLVSDYLALVNTGKAEADKITEGDIDPSIRYTMLQGEYQQFNNGEYVLYSTGVEESLGNVLGGIVGDLDNSMIRVLEGFTGELVFEIKINLSYRIDFAPAFKFNIFDLDLGIDLWRRENDGANQVDGTLTHMIGIYYDHDIDTGAAGLYLDLEWLLGKGGKLAVDVSDYPIETLLADLLSGGLSLGSSEAMAAGGAVDEYSDPSVAGVYINFYTRKLALAVTKGFVGLLLQLLNVDITEGLLPNFAVKVGIGLNPYVIGLDIDLFNSDGTKGVLSIGLDLQLFNGTEDSSAIDFGTIEDFNTRNTSYKDSVIVNPDLADNHIFYYGNFVRNDDAAFEDAYVKVGNAAGQLPIDSEIRPEDAVDTGNGVFHTDSKYYVKATEVYLNATAFENAVASGVWAYEKAEDVFMAVKDDSVFNTVITVQNYIDMLNSNNNSGTPYTVDNVLNSETREFVEPAKRYIIEGGNAVCVGDSTTFTHVAVSTKVTSLDRKFIDVYKAFADIEKYYAPAWNRAESGALYSYDELTDTYTEVSYDANGVATGLVHGETYYKAVNDFTNYSTIMNLDLGALLAGGEIDIASLLGDLKSIELDLSLAIDLKLSDVINWTEQMTKFVSTELYDYFEFILASADWDNANFSANIGLTLDIKAKLNIQNLLGLITGGGNIMDALKGLEAYIKIGYNTNYHNENAAIELWVNIDNDGKLNLYLNLEDMDKIVGMGDFFTKVKFEGLDLGGLLGGGGEAEASAETLGTELSVETNNVSTGLLPENIFDIINIILGQVLFGHDIIAVGLNDKLLVDLVKMLAPDFEGADYLPMLNVTEGADTSGVVINIGGGAPSIGVNLGFVVGYESYAEASEYANYDGVKFSLVDDKYVVDAAGTHVMVSSDKYALVDYANPVWTGDRYELNADGVTFTKVFSAYSEAEVGYTGTRYSLVNGQYVIDADGSLKKNANTFTLNGAGEGGFVKLNAEDLAVERLTRYAAIGTDGGRYLPVDGYKKLSGKGVASSRETYDVTTAGDYLLIGDFSFGISIYGLGIFANGEHLSNAQADGSQIDKDGKNVVDYADITKTSLNLSLAMDINYYGSADTTNDNNIVDMSELLGLILGLVNPDSDMTGSTLRLNIMNNMGNSEYPSGQIKLSAYLNLNDFAATEIALEILQYDDNGVLIEEPILGAYLANDNVYIDASHLLGETAKLYLSGLGLSKILEDALGSIFGGGEEDGEAVAATSGNAGGLTIHDWAFIQAMIRPQYFSLTLSVATINAIINKVYEAQGKELGNLIPNLGEVMLDAYGYAPVNGVDERPYWMSINVKMTEGFYGSIDITEIGLDLHKQAGFGAANLYEVFNAGNAKHVEMGNKYVNMSAEEAAAYEGTKYVSNGNGTYTESALGTYRYEGTRYTKIEAGYALAEAGYDGQRYSKVGEDYVTDEDGDYKYVEEQYVLDRNGNYIITYGEAYNIATGEIGIETIGAALDISLTISSAGITKYDAAGNLNEEYGSTFVGWVENLLVGLLGGTSLLGEFKEIGANEVYDGQRYSFTNDTYVKDDNGNYKFVMADVILTLPQKAITIDISVKADINLPAILKYGLSGILYSDLALDIRIGEILDTSFLAVYWLGSARLVNKNNMYELAVADPAESIFADSLYVDASGLGLGKINFHGLAGLLGAKPVYPQEGDGEAASSEEATSSAAGSGITLDVELEEGRIGISADSALINALMGLLGLNLGDVLDGFPLEKINIGLNFDLREGLKKLAVEAALDSYGTALALEVANLKVSVNEPLLDVEALYGQFKTGHAGLTMSSTAGTMALIQNIIDSLNPALSITIDRRVWAASMGNLAAATNGAVQTENVPTRASLTGTRGIYDRAGTPNSRIHFSLQVTHPNRSSGSGSLQLGLDFYNNSLFIIDLDVSNDTLNGLVNNTIGGIALSNADGSHFIALTKNGDGDNATYTYPTNESSSTGGDSGDSGSGDTGSTDGTWTYSYPLKLDGLIKKLELNLFNSNGYIPYFAGMGALDPSASDDTRYISIKLTLGREAYNELLIFLYTTILGLFRTGMAGLSETGIDDAASSDTCYFVDINKVAKEGDGIQGGPVRWGNYTLGERDVSEGYLKRLFQQLDGKTLEEKITLLEPVVRSIPSTVYSWLINDVVAGLAGIELGGLVNLFFGGTVANLSKLIAGILPLPFAHSGAPDPTANIYLDINPDKTDYGFAADSTYKMYSGIQAIELYVNCTKTEAGTRINTYRNTAIATGNVNNIGKTYASSSDYEANKRVINSFEEILNNGTAGGANDGWDYLSLRIGPYDNDGDGANNAPMLGFLEAEKVEYVDLLGQTEPPESIIVTDIATREATADGKPIILNETYLEDPAYFPQRAKVTWLNGYDSVGSEEPGNKDYNGGTMIIWDASTVDLSAASLDSNGEYLAGYVYGYVLNKVMYAIPVYTTTAFALTNVYAYEQTGVNAFSQKAISLDMNATSNKFNTSMPDLVRLKFQNMKTYTFGTVLEDASGNKLMAFAKDKATLGTDATGAQMTNGDGNTYKLEYAYKAAAQYVVANDADVDSFNAGTLKFGLYTKIGTDYIPVAAASAVKGNTYYKVLTEMVGTAEYAVLDYSKLPTGSVGRNFPVGWIDWDNYTYNWAGGAVEVGFTYQWGFTNEIEDSITVSMKGYEVNPAKISSFATKTLATATDSDKIASFDAFDAFGNLNTVLANSAYNNSLAEYIKTFTYVNGKYTSGQYTDLSVEWDLTALEERLAEIAVKDGDTVVGYDYYKGIDVVVTAKVGANVFRYIAGYDATGAPIYGFTGAGETATDGSVAQVISVPVKVAGRVFSSLETEALTFDVYSSDVIDGASFNTNVKAMFEGDDKAVVLDSNSLVITAPYVWEANDYKFVEGGVKQSEFSYMGYDGKNLYAKLEIGTEKSGKQTVYVPINVSAMTANVYRLNVEREHTLDPEWFNLSDSYNILTINFKEKGVSSHTMKPDWSTVKYYSNATYTKEIDNIFKGGTVYATVEANPCDADGNVLVGADGNAFGSLDGQAQIIKIRLTVPKKAITSVKFLANTDDTDVFTSGAIDDNTVITDAMLKDLSNYTATGYAEYVLDGTTYNLSSYDYTLNPDNYFRVGDWGDYRNGTAVAITYTTDGIEYTEIAFVRAWNLNGFNVNAVGGDRYVLATVGAQEFRIKLNTPSLAITNLTLSSDSAVKFVGGALSADVDFAGETTAFEYNVFDAWSLPTVVTVKGEHVSGAIADVNAEWIDDSAPGVIAEDFITNAEGKKVFRTDENGAYVIRQVKFYNEGNVTYPANGAFSVKIYLVGDNGESILDNAANVDVEHSAPNDLSTVYNAFGTFELPTTATVVFTDETATKTNVPVVWSAGAPTSQEVAAGTFTRTAYIGANLMSAEYTFTVVYGYTVDVLGEAGALEYALTADKFYGGLPTTATIYPDSDNTAESYEATLRWYVSYNNKGEITSALNGDGTVNVRIQANGINLTTRVALTVEATEIVSADGTGVGEFIIDPLGMDTTIFKQGATHTVVATNGTEEDGTPRMQTAEVVANYELPEDFFTNTTKYFGKTLTLTVTFTYPGGSQTMDVECLVKDRTILKTVDPAYRSITVDPYLYDSFREGGLGLPLEIEAILTDGSVATFVPEWPSDSLISAEGYEDSDYMVTFKAYAVAEDGEYVKYTYQVDGITVTRYGTVQEADELGATYDDTRYKTGATQQVNIPLVVISREVEKAEFVAPDYAKVGRSDARNTYTIRYTSLDSTKGEIVDVVYDAEDNIPEEVIYYNAFSFGMSAMPTEMDVTFAKTGEIKRYYVVFEGVENIKDGMDITSTVEFDAVAHVYPNSDMAFELFSFGVTFTFKKIEVTRFNSNIASETMSNDLRYDSFEVYASADGGNSIYNVDNYASTTTFYPDGKFITVAEWNKIAEDGYRMSKYEGTGKYLYKVLGEGTVADGNVVTDNAGNRTGTMTYFEYDAAAKVYNVIPAQGAADTTYIFVYTVSQELNAEWDPYDTEIAVRGGEEYVYATLTNGSAVNNATATVRVPVVVLDGTAVSMSANHLVDAGVGDFVDPAQVSDYMAVVGNTLVFTFDPFVVTDVFEQLESGYYKYFPAYANFTFANGTEVNLPISWKFGIATLGYAGGTYNITAVVDGSEYGVDEQEVRARLVIVNRSAVSVVEAENPELISNVGYLRHDGGTQTYINPYEYFSSSLVLPDYLTVNVNGAFGNEVITFRTDDENYTLGWSTGDFRPTYNGGIIYLTALLTGPDGSTQKFQIPFLVQRVLATKITTLYRMDEERVASPVVKNSRYDVAPYTSNVTGGVAGNYYIDAGVAASYTVPEGIKATFSVENPVVDAEGNLTGFVASANGGTGWDKHANGDKFSKVFAHVSVTMPANFKLTAALLAGNETVSELYANMQLGTGERIQIPVKINAKTNDGTAFSSGNTLRTRLNNGVGVAWSGIAIAYAADGTTEVARYSVTIASNRSTYTLESVGGRKVVYYLVPYVGAVVDVTSALLDTTTATANVTSGSIVVIARGQEVPAGTAGSVYSFTV